MWMPEFLGKEGNKLLKLIEEPPAKTLFILVAENEELVLPTILSRTQLVKIPALSDQEIGSSIGIKRWGGNRKSKANCYCCRGNYREALQMIPAQ
jgi:DNA polymerase-3 subunit delta'